MSLVLADESIMSDADKILKRLVEIADGTIAEITPEGVRIYSKPPDLICIRYLMAPSLAGPISVSARRRRQS